jgi:hypothetical protein
LLLIDSLENINVHSAKKVWSPKKVTTKPMNLKSFNESCGAINGIKREKINWCKNKNSVINTRAFNILVSVLLINKKYRTSV